MEDRLDAKINRNVGRFEQMTDQLANMLTVASSRAGDGRLPTRDRASAGARGRDSVDRHIQSDTGEEA